VAKGNVPDITNSNFEAEVDLITRLAESEKINFVRNGPLWTQHILSRVTHFRMSTDRARRAHRQGFDALSIRTIVFVEDSYVEADMQGATDRHEVLQNVLCLNKPNSPAIGLVFYTADVAPQLLLWPLHCLVSVLSIGHLPSQVSQVLRFIPRGDAVQSSESIGVWMKETRIAQRTFPCTNSHDYYRQLG